MQAEMLKTELLQHQKKAIEKLQRYKISALYMDPGTGKTLTTLKMALYRLERGKIDKVLWLCPCSLKKSLELELLKHIDDISFIKICGLETVSLSPRTYLELLDFVKVHSVYLVVDESNFVKNFYAKRTERVIELAQHCPYRSILNGTPISRNEADLFAQWYILDWRVLGYKSYYSFAANHLEYDDYGKVRRVLETSYLTEKIAPFTYQVRLEDCVDLPEKEDYTAYLFLSTDQLEHMHKVGQGLLLHVDERKPETLYRFLTGMQLVASGYKLGVREYYSHDYSSEVRYSINMKEKERFYKDPRDNPRIEKLLNLLKDYEYDEKVIIYAKYTDEINEIMQVLEDIYGEGSAVRFDGNVSLKERNENLVRFAEDARFLVANKQCAGYGLNLQFAHIVIFFSNDWDWATREQAEKRVHRIGQTKNVQIIDMVARGTIDVRINQNLSRKTDLVDELKNEINVWKDKKVMDMQRVAEWLQPTDGVKGELYCH